MVISVETVRPPRSGLELIGLLVGVFILAAVCACDHGLSPVDEHTTGLHLRVTLVGERPEDTGVVGAALFRTRPTSSESELPAVFKEAPQGSMSFSCTWDVTPGVYDYLVVAWLREGEPLFNFDVWVELGLYADPRSPDVPAKVLITPGVLRHIDLVGDYAKVPPPAGGTVEMKP